MSSQQFGNPHVPMPSNEPLQWYAPNSDERAALKAALEEMLAECPDVPCVVNGEEIRKGDQKKQVVCTDHQHTLCTFYQADEETIQQAIEGALAAKEEWEAMSSTDRFAIFKNAGDLLASPQWRYKVMAATMLGQGKNVHQAEIDAAAETIDFLRFNPFYANEIYNEQPPKQAGNTWNRMEYRPLEGFVVAISPFNFTAIGANLPTAPAMMGNVVMWKPASTAILSNYLIYQILVEAGMPAGVIQFLPSRGSQFGNIVFEHRDFAGLHFTGSSETFNTIYQQTALNLSKYRTYPRIVGETGGKNMHFIHESANIDSAVNQTLRGAFEYQGQKCSATSRLYLPDTIADEFLDKLVAGVQKFKVGPVTDFDSFVCAVIDKPAFDSIASYIDWAKDDESSEILVGGTYDDSEGYFIQPTIILTSNPKSKTMEEEIFGPVLTVYKYAAAEYEEALKLADETSPYALTCALFAKDRKAVSIGANALRNTAGNFYINDKSTGAVVGQQPFGGARASGTNDKAGHYINLLRWTSVRSIKETSIPLQDWSYPHMSEA